MGREDLKDLGKCFSISLCWTPTPEPCSSVSFAIHRFVWTSLRLPTAQSFLKGIFWSLQGPFCPRVWARLSRWSTAKTLLHCPFNDHGALVCATNIDQDRIIRVPFPPVVHTSCLISASWGWRKGKTGLQIMFWTAGECPCFSSVLSRKLVVLSSRMRPFNWISGVLQCVLKVVCLLFGGFPVVPPPVSTDLLKRT